MKRYIIRLFTLTCLAGAVFSCKKDYDGLGPLEDSIAAIPVTVPNQDFFEFVPIKTTSLAAGGNISIQLRIPQDKGKIKEITRVTTGTNGRLNLQTGASTTAFNYVVATTSIKPIAGNGTNEITFTSTVKEYTDYRTRVGAATAGPAAVVAMTTDTPPQVNQRNPTQLQFFFLITLEDGTQIIPSEVRVRILP